MKILTDTPGHPVLPVVKHMSLKELADIRPFKSYYPPEDRKLQSLFGSQVVLGIFDGLEEPKVNTEHRPSARQPSYLYTSVIICRSA